MSGLLNPTRRGFFGLLGAAVAMPAIVKASSLMAISPVKPIMRPLAASFIETKEIYAANVLRGVSLAEIPGLLLPGLRELHLSYAPVESEWAKVFAQPSGRG